MTAATSVQTKNSRARRPRCRAAAKPELKFHGTKGDDVAVAEPRGLNGLAVDGGQGVWRGGKREALLPLKFQREVLVPDAVVVELQIISGARPMRKGKRRATVWPPAFLPERMLS